MINFTETEPIFSIGIAASKLQISVPTLRMYEKAGLLIPHRSETGRRFYSLADLKRVTYIRKLIKEEGLNLTGIRRLMAILPCWEVKESCTVKARKKCPVYTDSKKLCWISCPQALDATKDSCKKCTVYLRSCELMNNLKSTLKPIE